MDGQPPQGEGGGVKKRAPPKLERAELLAKVAERLEAGFPDPAERLKFVLGILTGWDLETLLTILPQRKDK